MKTEEEQTEWNYRYDERLGILCGALEPTSEQKKIAADETNAWFEEPITP